MGVSGRMKPALTPAIIPELSSIYNKYYSDFLLLKIMDSMIYA